MTKAIYLKSKCRTETFTTPTNTTTRNSSTDMSCYRKRSQSLFLKPISCQKRNGEILEFNRVKDGSITWRMNPSLTFCCSEDLLLNMDQKLRINIITLDLSVMARNGRLTFQNLYDILQRVVVLFATFSFIYSFFITSV